MDPVGSILLFDILQVLKEHTDEDQGLGQKDIIDLLERKYGYEKLKNRRLTVKRNLEKLIHYQDLRDLNEITMDTNIRQSKDTKTGEVEEVEVHSNFVYEHDFTHEELYLIIDSLIFSEHIPSFQRKDMIKKLEGLTSKHFESRLDLVQTMSNSDPMNKQLFNTIRSLYEAISKNKKVAFEYEQYAVDNKGKLTMQARPNQQGKPRQYVINPYELVATNGRYYLICNYDPFDNLSHYRVDRILNIRLLDQQRKSLEDLDEGISVDLSTYMREHIYMFSGETITAEMRFNKRILGEFIDWFGNEGIQFKDQCEKEVTVSVRVNREAMRKWALQYGVHVQLLSPEDLVEDIKKDIQKAWSHYES